MFLDHLRSKYEFTSERDGLNEKIFNSSAVDNEIKCYVHCMNEKNCSILIYNPRLNENCYLGNNKTTSNGTFSEDILVGANIWYLKSKLLRTG